MNRSAGFAISCPSLLGIVAGDRGRAAMTRVPRSSAFPAQCDHEASGAIESPQSKRRTTRIIQIAAAFLLALFVLALGIRAPFEKDAEPQSAQWIEDIVRNGNWLLPHDYYGNVDRKPPLFYWFSAIVADATGSRVDAERARVVSLLAGAGVAVEVMAWATASLGTGAGWLAFAFLLGTYGFASRATTALTDMLMTLILFSVYLLVRPLIEGDRSRARIAVGGTLLGLGVLTKGPVVIVLLALAASIYLLLKRENPLTILKRPWPWLMLAISIAIAAAWYVPALMTGHRNDFGGVFIDENFGHFMPASMGGTGEAARPVYYIVARLAGGMMPLTLLAIPLVLALAAGDFAEDRRDRILYQAALALSVIVLFSAASAKRDDYILPAIPPLAILFAALFTLKSDSTPAMLDAAKIRDLVSIVISATIVVSVLSLLVALRRANNFAALTTRMQSSDATYASLFVRGLADMTPPFACFIAAAIISPVICVIGTLRGRPLMTGGGLAALCLACSLLWTGVLRPLEAETRCAGRFAAEVHDRVGNALLYVAYPDPEFAWYYGSGVPPLPRLLARSGPPPGSSIFLVARARDRALLSPVVRKHLEVVLRSNLPTGGGGPNLYRPSADNGPPASSSME